MKTIAYQKLALISVVFSVDATPIWTSRLLRSMRAASALVVDSDRAGGGNHPAIGGEVNLAL